MALRTRKHSVIGLVPTGLPSSYPTALSPPAHREPYSDWYLGNSQTRWSDPARDAYDAAVEALRKELSADEYKSIRLKRQNSMQHVQDALSDAMQEYRTRSKSSKIRTWLASCSSRVMYYGAIFDTFSQHHPEYVSLAWGAMKFLFIAVLNHEELLTEISKAVAKIADVLPRTELHSILYPTERMQEAVALVYAKILEFSVVAIKWYKEGKLMHTFSSIAKPFSIKFKPILEEIAERSRRVDELASAASKAEIRDLHIKIHGLTTKMVQLTEMVAFQQQQQALHNERLFAFQGEYKHMFRKAQVEDVQNSVLLADAPSADDTLGYCRSMRNRRRKKLPTQLPAAALSKLKSWVADRSSSLLLAQGQGVRTSSLDFAADFLDAVLEHGYPVLWALPFATEDGPLIPSIVNVIRGLISQILNLDPSILGEGSHPMTIKHFKSASSIQQWLALLERCLLRFNRIFIVFDLGLIEAAVDQDDGTYGSFKVDDFIQELSDIVDRRDKGGLKVIVVSWKFNIATTIEMNDVFGDLHIATDMGKRAERLMRQPKYRVISRKRAQAVADKLRDSVEVSNI
ncbi:hypothetical protein F5Y15DRAFT_412990 [Xylariaceae sp. FL0016]|nr:hypothetical protein F5Y15DRAFT_412990 [Xylariaceae sp. FL0016]